ncbi:hypothetical protein PGT21_036541 [Puccinia graminis f. sp. tritici]|uniref:Uncharacterized protein n=1 Tax=Puccinia graminis f. sp. tritici TaxID=56615 RepID=A0A5B0R4L7_PUCGR|nr:hypothetical protein PGT21_036541 [Puccinia graminis f. sp. tritici]
MLTRMSADKSFCKYTPVEITDNLQQGEGPSKATKARAKEILLAKVVKAQEDGDEAKADRLFAMYESITVDSTPIFFNSKKINAEISVIPKKQPVDTEFTTQVRGIKSIWSNPNLHNDGGFTPYFYKNILELKGRMW